MAYINVKRIREMGIVVATITTKLAEYVDELPKPVQKRARTIITYTRAIIDAIAEEVPPERREAMKRNIYNYILEIKPKTARVCTAEEGTIWCLDVDQISALIALDPDECMLCDRWTEEEQRSCPRRRILSAMDISIKCDNALDDPSSMQWVDD